jgi:hypothetical protein
MAEAQDATVRSNPRAGVADVPVLELRDVHKSFGAVHALQGASLGLTRQLRRLATIGAGVAALNLRLLLPD